jgi:hypothetical protein
MRIGSRIHSSRMTSLDMMSMMQPILVCSWLPVQLARGSLDKFVGTARYNNLTWASVSDRSNVRSNVSASQEIMLVLGVRPFLL